MASSSEICLLPTEVANNLNSGLDLFLDLIQKPFDVSLNIKSIVDQLYEHFSNTERMLDESIKTMGDNCAREEANLSREQREVQDLEKSMVKLQEVVQEMSEKVKRQEEKVKDAKREVRQSESRVEEAEEKLEAARRDQRYWTTVAIITAFIPYVNIVATPSLLIYSLTALEADVKNARGCLSSAKSTLSTDVKDLKEVIKSKEEKEKELERVRKRKSDLKDETATAERNIKSMRKQLTQKHDLLYQLRDCMKYLSKISGRAEVLRDETTFIHDVSQIVVPMRYLVESLVAVPECYLSTRAITSSSYWRRLREQVEEEDDSSSSW